MSRRFVIVLFDILAIFFCFIIHSSNNLYLGGVLSSSISLLIVCPIIFFIVKKKPNNVTSTQTILFRVLGFVIDILSEIPIVGFLLMAVPLVFYGITISLIQDITGTSFFSYFLLISICLRFISEVIWYFLSKKYESKKNQIN